MNWNLFISNIMIPKEYRMVSREDKAILYNTALNTWMALSPEEVKLFYEIKGLMDCQGIGTFPEETAQNKSSIMKMIFNQVLYYMKDPTLKTKDPNFALEVAYFMLTERCNLNCIYCYADADETKELLMNTEACKAILDELKSQNCKQVIFTGGEATLRSDLFELVAYAKKLGLRVGMISNGTLIHEGNYEKFACFDAITISLDAANEHANDVTRGKGTYKKITKALELLKKLPVHLAVESVLTKFNYEHLYELISYVSKDLGVAEHIINIAVPLGRGASDYMICGEEAFIRANEHIQKIKKDVIGLKLENVRGINMIRKRAKRVVCGAGSAEIAVSYTGDVFPCRLFASEEHLMGNLFKAPLSEIFKSQSLKSLKEKIHVDHISECKSCDIRYLCGGGCRKSHEGFSKDISVNASKLCEFLKKEAEELLFMKTEIEAIKSGGLNI